MDRRIFLKNGIMEYWNFGMVFKKERNLKTNIPFIHYSIIPISKRREI